MSSKFIYKMLQHCHSNIKYIWGWQLRLECDSRWKNSEVWCFISKTEVLSVGFVIIKADALLIIIYTDPAFFWHPVQWPGFEIKFDLNIKTNQISSVQSFVRLTPTNIHSVKYMTNVSDIGDEYKMGARSVVSDFINF